MRTRSLTTLLLALLAPVLGMCAAASAPAPSSASPAPKLQRLRIVGGLANVHQFTRHEEPFWTQKLPALSAGRLTAEIVPFDRAGIRGQDMLRLVQLGAVPFGTALLAQSATYVPELAAPDLAGLNPTMESLRANVAAFRPALIKLLKERYDIEVLALYVYPAQVTYCIKLLRGIADLNGRRVRVSSTSQADFVTALGGTPVRTEFSQIVADVRSGNIDCAITGTMSGNTIGLDQVTHHIHTLPITWGIAAFVANGSALKSLPSDLQVMLRKELTKLEQAIWTESAQETGEGIACNSGAPECGSGHRGNMKVATTTAADERRRLELLTQKVLPAWIERCGPPCATLWQSTIANSSAVQLP